MALFKKSQPTPKPVGKFIVIEGSEGADKNTQIELLAKTLGSYDYEGMVFDFPQYSSVSAEMLTNYSEGKYGDLNPEAVSILFALDRFDAGFDIRKHLSEGKIILANRYTSSSAAHQGSKILDRTDRIKFYKWLDNLEHITFNIPKPDLTIILHSNQNKSEVNSAYAEISSLFPNTKLVECTEQETILSPQEIHSKVWELVRRIVLRNNSF